jgi:transposase
VKASTKITFKSMQNYKFYLGLDISKATVDLALCSNESEEILVCAQVPNQEAGYFQMLNLLSERGIDAAQVLCCMENTGLYSRPFLNASLQSPIAIWVEQPYRIKNTQKLNRGKSDPMDAKRISWYARRYQDKSKLWEPDKDVIEQLKELTSVRNQLLNCRKEMQVSMKECKGRNEVGYDIRSEHYLLPIEAINEQLRLIEKRMEEVISSDISLEQTSTIIRSIPGVGLHTVSTLICMTENFTKFDNPRSFACYAGVAPFPHQSGTSIRGRDRVSHMANKKLKTILHLTSMRMIRFNDEMKDYFARKVAEGKSKMSVLNAIRNKFIHLVFSLIKRGEQYIPIDEFVNKKEEIKQAIPA